MPTYNIIASGGIRAAGTATNTHRLTGATSGGARGGGSPTFGRTFTETPSGGLLGAGDNNAYRSHDAPTWSINITGDQVTDPVTTTSSAEGEIWYNASTNLLSWRITHTGFDSPLISAGFYSAPSGFDGGQAVSLGVDLTSPIVGSVTLSDVREAELLFGLFYVTFNTDDHPQGEIRGQVWNSGVAAGGDAFVTPYIETGSGGVVAAGQATVFPYFPEGGAECSGTAEVTSVYQGDLPDRVYAFYLDDEKFVGADLADNTIKASAVVRVDVDLNTIYWDIRHTLTGIDLARFTGPNTKSQAGPEQILIESLQSIASPIIGSTTISDEDETDIRDGLWALVLTDSNAAVPVALRGQVSNESSRVAGLSTVEATYSLEAESSGGLLGGTAAYGQSYVETASDGALGAGDALNSIEVPTSGGAVCGGTSDMYVIRQISVSSFGVQISGATTPQVTYNPVIVLTGALAAGRAVPGIQSAITGSILAAGTATSLRLALPAISGGAVVSPDHVKQQTYNGIVIGGTAKIGGRARAEKLRFFSGTRSGYGRAMASSNFLSQPTVPDTGLIDPVGATSPDLSENRFSIQHEPGWCEVEVKCVDGVLPRIIQNRQRGILPPKRGRIRTTNRSLASSTAST